MKYSTSKPPIKRRIKRRTNFGVYVVLLPTGILKVGKGPLERAYAGQTFFHEPLKVLAFWEFGSSQAAFKREKQAHEALAAWHIIGTPGNSGVELFSMSADRCLEILDPLMTTELPKPDKPKPLEV